MELEDLDNINKNDFLPLLPLNIKQELLDHNVGSAASGDSGMAVDDDGTTAGAASGSSGGGGTPAGSGNINDTTSAMDSSQHSRSNSNGLINTRSNSTNSNGGDCGGSGKNEQAANLCDNLPKQSDETTTASGEPISPSKCVWCAQHLTASDAPKLLECLHVACGQCVTARFSEIDRTQPPLVHCPLCSMASQPDQIIDNQFLIEQVHHPHHLGNTGDGSGDGSESTGGGDKAPVIKCSSCSDDAPATSWCVECSEFICDSCVQAHQRLKITKDHTIKTKEEAATDQQNGGSGSGSAADKSLLCHAHPAEKLSLFCETCDKLTCRDCQLVDHRDHKYKFAHEIAAETRTCLGGLLSEITYKRVLLNSAMKVIDDRQTLIADKKKELVKEITTMVVKITNTVNMRGKQLVMRLNEVCDSKLKVLNEKKDALQLLSGHTDHCIDFVQTALDRGSDNAVLFSKKTLSRHLQKVKCQRADIPNPEIPVRIQVQLNQVQELQKVISQVGTIIVDGKAYPPIASSPGLPNRSQQPSPNMLGGVGGVVGGPSQMRAPSTGSGQSSGCAAASGGAGPSGMMSQQTLSQSLSSPLSQQQQHISGGPQSQPPPHYGSPPVYNAPSPQMQQQQQQQQQFNMQQQMNRPQFGPDQASNAFLRFPNMGPHMRGQVAPHVSSSTHPQNMGGGSAVNPGGGNPMSGGGGNGGVFNSGPAGPFGMQVPSAAAVAAAAAVAQQQHQHQLQQQQLQHQMQQQQQQHQHQQAAAAAVMARGFMPGGPQPSGSGGVGGAGGYGSSGGNGPIGVGPGSSGSGGGGGGGGAVGSSAGGPQQAGGNGGVGGGPGGFMPNGPRYQNFQHRMQPGGPGTPGSGSGGVAGPPMMRPIMQGNNDMRFAAGQQNQVFGQGHPSNHPPHNHAGGPAAAAIHAQNQQQLQHQQQQQQQQHQQQQQQQQQAVAAAAAAAAAAQQMVQQHAPAKWHIPQSVQQNNGMAGPSAQSPLMQFGMRQNENSFKISLKSPNTLKSSMGGGSHNGSTNNSAAGSTGLNSNSGNAGCPSSSSSGQSGGPMGGTVAPNVSSTNPKTPSPSTNDNTKDFSDSIDKACEESVNDLMATIAKLDSNGVQVLPEGRGKTTSPQVHSSTDMMTIGPVIEIDKNGQKDDPNEDWCAVCLDGGELMCCDKCPKVFHQTCHIPNISSLPDESETWQCLLCVNLAELRTEPMGEKRAHGLSASELKIIQRICLELLCQYEQSLSFRDPEPKTNASYYEIISNPISLGMIRSRLDMTTGNHYNDVMSFVNDVRQLFKNVYLYYREDSKVFEHARYLDQFFEQQLRKWLPSYTIGRTVASELNGLSATGSSSSGNGTSTSAAAAMAALRGGVAGDTQTFGDGSVVIGMKRSRISAPDACD